MEHVKRIAPIGRLNLKLQCWSQVYVILVMPKYLLVYNTISITGAGTDDAAKRADERNKGVIFKKLCTIQWMRTWNKQCSNR